ncbi:MAG: hypothetical protein HYY55_02080 [Candidatus Niyogibacteria bacterium]|nr:MAG: hypothetical protein HYY55_02080 [Candidatus Niyogibacteria bacterium]
MTKSEFQKHDLVIVVSDNIEEGIVRGQKFLVLGVQNLLPGRQMIEIEIFPGYRVCRAAEFFQKVRT